jgi:hypothetical protein
MLNSIAKIALTATAMAPVGLTYAYAAWFAGETEWMWGLLLISLLLVMICVYVLRRAKIDLERMIFQAQSVEAADRENMGLLVLYLLPLFTDDFVTLNWQIAAPMLIIFAVVVGTGYSYHFNPLLGLLGWHFYKVSTPEGVTYVLITKKRLHDARNTIVVGQLTEYIVLDLE